MNIKKRKRDHLKLVKAGFVNIKNIDKRFHYEPLLKGHNEKYNYEFLNREIGGPIFLSSITGGSKESKRINSSLVTASNEMNIPMGLGSIRPLLDDPKDNSFNLKGNFLFGNIGIAQLHRWEEINRVIKRLNLFGLIIHINPLQEWCQPGGDRYKEAPLATLDKYVGKIESKLIVKEVGCGFGPKSLKELLSLPIDVVDTAGFGGTNFTEIELLRSKKSFRESFKPLINIGVSNEEMVREINKLLAMGYGSNMEFIISGGIRDFLDGYYYTSLLKAPGIYGYAGKVLQYAKKGSDSLIEFIDSEIQGFNLSRTYLTLKE